MTPRTAGLALALSLGMLLEGGAEAAEPAPPPRRLELSAKPWTGDFDRMLERRIVRVLVPYSRTLYYNDRGRERGITAEIAREWEVWINRTYRKQLGARPVTVYLIPTTRDKLLTNLVEGLGDVAAGDITVTEARLRLVDFVAPSDIFGVNEIVAAGPGAPAVASVADLSGKTVHVRSSTSYHESLLALNARFAREGQPPVTLAPLPDALEDEDMLDMVNVGLLDLVVVDDWLARVWSPTLPNVRLVPQAALRTGGRIGWAIRKQSPKLEAALTAFYGGVARTQGLVGYLHVQSGRRVKQFRNNTADAELKRFEEILALFRTYGARYHFDPLMLAAQGYQESRLEQGVKSPVGAIGVMQVMPATGEQLKVGDIRLIEPNIHAGAKYLDRLMTAYFADAKLADDVRTLFAFAAYNAGPGRIAGMRRLAAQRGFDPDQWFNHVEVVTAERVGIETPTYVRNIYKYYVSYRLIIEAMERRRALQEDVRRGR
jgi:membrane-bound lytic murein transglycosylase MltF